MDFDKQIHENFENVNQIVIVQNRIQVQKSDQIQIKQQPQPIIEEEDSQPDPKMLLQIIEEQKRQIELMKSQRNMVQFEDGDNSAKKAVKEEKKLTSFDDFSPIINPPLLPQSLQDKAKIIPPVPRFTIEKDLSSSTISTSSFKKK